MTGSTTTVRSRRGRPVLLRLVVATAVVAAMLLAFATQASSAPNLPTVAPEQLVASTLRALAAEPPVSGDVRVHLDLGLPQLLDGVAAGALRGPLAALAGDHRLLVWASTDGMRVADVQTAGERSIVSNGRETWAWDSNSFTAWHVNRPAGAGLPAAPESIARELDPMRLARQALAAIRPTTTVSIDANAWIAGRAAYVLVLEPKTSGTLVGRVKVWIDAERRLPLGMAVYPRGGDVAPLSSQFHTVRFAAVAPSIYRFTPPPGATVHEATLPGDRYQGAGPSPSTAPRVFGESWSTVVAVPLPPEATSSESGLQLSTLPPFSGPLFSIRVAHLSSQSWLLAGAVPQSRLEAVARTLS